MFTNELIGSYQVSRTIQYQFDCIADIFHFVVDALNLVIDPNNFVINALSERQELRRCHSSFFLRQLIQSPQRIFDIPLSQQPPQILF